MLALGLLVAAPAWASDKIDPELQALMQSLGDGETTAVIIEFSDKVDLERFRPLGESVRRMRMVTALRRQAAITQGSVTDLLRQRAARKPVELWLINALALAADADLIGKLAARPEVASIRADRTIQLVEATQAATAASPVPHPPAADQGREGATTEWNIAAINAPTLWSQGIDGDGVVVASLDSGVDATHPDLADRWRSAAGWFDPHGEHSTPSDATGHGTHVMGLIVGGDAGGTSIGVAPGARWIAAKIFDDSGATTLSAIHQCFQWLLDPDGLPATDDAPDIANNSWGLTDNINQCILEFRPDVQALKLAGIAVVFSAGNAGNLGGPTSLSPANNPEGFAVGMVDDGMSVDPQSSRGPSACDVDVYPELVAPGVLVWTADLLGQYTEELGTSFAAPHVSGAMALLLQQYPGATVEELELALKDSATDLGTPGPDNAYGYGLIDVPLAAAELSTYACPDGDGDGRGAGAGCLDLDCDDAAGDVWSAPGPARDLTFGGDHQTLTWAAPIDPGAEIASLHYDIIRSGDRSDFLAGTCIESDDATDTVAVDPQSPPSGLAFYYVVRPENDCGSGLTAPAASCP
jgi:hypothetical protein